MKIKCNEYLSIISWRSQVIPRGTQILWLGATSHNFLLNVKKSFSCVAKIASGYHRYCHAVVSSWAIKHFDFQKLEGLWLVRLINNHVRVYGSNVAEGFSAFQRLVIFLSVCIYTGTSFAESKSLMLHFLKNALKLYYDKYNHCQTLSSFVDKDPEINSS